MRFPPLTPRQRLMLLGIGAAVAVAIVVPIWRNAFARSIRTPGGEPYDLLIPTGADYVYVANLLRQDGVMTDPEGFDWTADKLGYRRAVKPGRYVVQHGMSNRELVQLLLSGKQTPVKFTFVKYRSLDELAAFADAKLELSKPELMEALLNPHFMEKEGLTPETLLGIFVPNTYEFYWNTNAKAFVAKMLAEYRKFWERNARNERRRKWGLTRMEVMTLAAIVEEETNQEGEKPAIAGVYLNRLKKPMPLQADPTVRFANGDFSIKRITAQHLLNPSPYNTYRHPGLPPGPICTPSIGSIDAVLDAQKHDYLYFCAAPDGSGLHRFAATYEEHLQNANAYQQNLDRRGIQ